ncbi:MAG: hypothetical protein E7158_03255 [Firmicutes bacterium]|nr:hypothetical protein [Bacillota bacterium]
MREVIGGTWITQLVIVFMFVFAAFLALSINYSKAFKIKNEVLNIIEREEGLTDNAIKLTNNYLVNTGYNTKGKCPKNSWGITVRGIGQYDKKFIENSSNKKYSFCVRKVKSTANNFRNRAYYELRLFFKFGLPVIGDITTFDVEGQSKDVTYPLDKLRAYSK